MSNATHVDWAKGIPDELRQRYERILFCAATVQYHRETNKILAAFYEIQKDAQSPSHTD